MKLKLFNLNVELKRNSFLIELGNKSIHMSYEGITKIPLAYFCKDLRECGLLGIVIVY